MDDPYKLAKNILLSGEGGPIAAPGGGFTSIELYGASACENAAADGGVRFHLENESGTGDITLYRVFPGIELVYNDMHMAYCNKHQQPAANVMEINYCKEGRSECLFGERRYCYMSAGDISFCSLHDSAHQSEFPTAHYHGITVTVDFSAITEEMEKVLELLAVMTGLEPAENGAKREYFPAAQIDTVKRIHAFLIVHYNEHYTIDALSSRFGISPTVMKRCFRGVYGDSVYSYMKRYRLNVAERMLREGTLTVG